MSELTMFAYPWDLAVEEPRQVVAELAARGVTRLAVAAAYHSASVIAPRRTAHVTTTAEANRAHLPLAPEAFGEVVLEPSTLATDRPELFEQIADAASEHGLDGVTGWVVALHNSDLAARHPELALQTCFGDRSGHGLCPSQPAVREYVRALAGAVAGTGRFDRVFLESASYLLAGHGHPHELWAVRLDPRGRLLLSLCFCDACGTEAGVRDIDAEGLRARCAERLHRAWNAPLMPLRAPDEGAELAALLVADPELAAYVRMRCELVSALVADVARALRERGVALTLSSAVWGRPAPLNWLEGVDLRRSGELADLLGVTTYTAALPDVARELDVVLADVDPARVMLLNTLWPEHHATAAELVAKVALAREAGVRSFALYNQATAPAATLPWIDAVANEVAR